MDPPQFLADGDVVRIEIEGLGVLEHTMAIRAAPPNVNTGRVGAGCEPPRAHECQLDGLWAHRDDFRAAAGRTRFLPSQPLTFAREAEDG